MIATQLAKRILIPVTVFLWPVGGIVLGATLDAWRAGDRDAAIAAWKVQADAGDAEAALFLGYVYRKGLGVEPDDTEAARHYRQAAEHGFAEAQHELALMYELGDGVPQDAGEAARWYGLSSAQFCPGELSAGGRLGD